MSHHSPARFRTTFGVLCVSILTLSLAATAASAATPTTQKQYRLVKEDGPGLTLRLVDAPVRRPGAREVLVRVHASALNRRDIMVARGQYPIGNRESLVPLSDGAGEVVEVGPGVTRFKVGDRVAAIFFQGWIDGRMPPTAAATALGGELDGMLTQYVTLSEDGLVHIPAHLSYEEAATLPCAGVTAWNGLFTRGRLQAGDYVLLQGTGGVSILGLQFAVAAGARPIITSSSDAKLERARTLGAVGTLNYRTTPQWGARVRELTGGPGVHHVLEVGGKDSLPQSLEAIAHGGHVALIGGLGGFAGAIPAGTLMRANVTVSGLYVGSRADFEAMNAFIERHRVKPVVDRVFEFSDAPAAFEYMDSGSHFGKVVIRH